jgi:ribosomal-protein-alanine N-acetyltransferase
MTAQVGSERHCPVWICWMVRKHMPEVLDIEEASFEFPWLEEDFIHCLRQRNCIGMAAEFDDRVVGFMIYELHKTRIHVLNFAVHPRFRRCGVGSQLVDKLMLKLSSKRRTRIVLEVRENNLPAQLFFQANKFRAISVMHEYYQDTPEDAYLLVRPYLRETLAELDPLPKVKKPMPTRYTWCPHKTCTPLIGFQSMVCGGRMVGLVPHDDDFNTHRLCILEEEDSDKVFDLQVNKNDCFLLSKVIATLHGDEHPCLEAGDEKKTEEEGASGSGQEDQPVPQGDEEETKAGGDEGEAGAPPDKEEETS